jgi:hypothetical protein
LAPSAIPDAGLPSSGQPWPPGGQGTASIAGDAPLPLVLCRSPKCRHFIAKGNPGQPSSPAIFLRPAHPRHARPPKNGHLGRFAGFGGHEKIPPSLKFANAGCPKRVFSRPDFLDCLDTDPRRCCFCGCLKPKTIPERFGFPAVSCGSTGRLADPRPVSRRPPCCPHAPP